MPVPVVSVAQMRDWEKATWAAGLAQDEVIRQAGLRVARRALRMTRPGDLVLILAGKGHNGDDARRASENLPDRQVGLINVQKPEMAGVELLAQLERQPSLIIDGIFGIGLNRPLDTAWIALLVEVNRSGVPVLAVDTPSGLNCDTGKAEGTAIRANVTLTLGAPKIGLLSHNAWPHVGHLEVAGDIGLIPCNQRSPLNWTLPEDFHGFPPPRPAHGHKGTFGHLAIVAGSLGYHGAGVLCARGALRARPGLVTVFTTENAYIPVASQLQAAMVRPWTSDTCLTVDEFSAVVFGPGLAGPDVPQTMRDELARVWQTFPAPVIADASALDWLPRGSTPSGKFRIITPHPGEAARLLYTTPDAVQSDRCETVRELSRRYGECWVVLKGHQTLIGRANHDLHVNGSGNPFLAQGGSGDVLAGYLGGLLAQPALFHDPFQTLSFGVWQHGAVADALAERSRVWGVEELVNDLGACPAES